MIRKILSSFITFGLLFGTLPQLAFAEEGEASDEVFVDSNLVSEVEVTVVSEEAQEAVETYEEEVFTEEEDLSEGESEPEAQEEGEVVVEEVDMDELDEEVVEDFTEAGASGAFPDTGWVSVRWGHFYGDGEEPAEVEPTVWDGAVSFSQGILGLPVKLLRFEHAHDALELSDVTAEQTPFVSALGSVNDGVLFKVRSDRDDTDALIEFETAYGSTSAVYATELFEAGSAEFDYGNGYKLILQIWRPEEWVKERGERADVDSSVAQDVEAGAWYEQFMNFGIEKGFFGGYKDSKGKFTGKIGPGDNVTRAEMLKMVYEMSMKLNLGAGANGCAPMEVAKTDATAWMGNHWARGYMECIYQYGDITLVDEIIGQSLGELNAQALRYEVIATCFEMLGLEASNEAESDLTDLDDADLQAEFKAFIEQAVELGIISGYSDHTFKPLRQVNRAEMFKIISLFFQVLSVE